MRRPRCSSERDGLVRSRGCSLVMRLTGSPSRCSRPPKTTATSRNQPQPSARPPRTSLTQWTPSSARLVATVMAMSAAPPASSARMRARPIAAEHQRHGRPARRRPQRCGPTGTSTRGRPSAAGRPGDRAARCTLIRLFSEQFAQADSGNEQEHLTVAAPHEVDRGDEQQHREHHRGAAEVGDQSITSTAWSWRARAPFGHPRRCPCIVLAVVDERRAANRARATTAKTTRKAAVSMNPPAVLRSIRCSRKRRTFG